MSNLELSMLFFLQLAVILAACRVVGYIASKIGQSQVVSEMIAGVVIGPSLLGYYFPEFQARLFPQSSMAIIYTVSQVGLVLYMFLIGSEFRIDVVRRQLRSAGAVSIAGIAAPFALGALITIFIQDGGTFFSAGVTRWEAMFFMGAAMSITAFPMLARIIQERGLTGTSLGTLALAAGSINDAVAWCILAIVLASFKADAWIAVSAIGGGVFYAIIFLGFGRPLLAKFAKRSEKNGGPSTQTIMYVLMVLMLGAWFTDTIGIYAVFGAFIFGMAMPRGNFSREFQQKIGPLTTSLLLPLYFVYSGLNTRFELVDSGAKWAIAIVILVAACFGKGIACWAAARLSGENNRDSMAIGTLMNARGLMELILLNIGLERGIITPTLFTIMVLMAISTTLMATPLFELVYRRGSAIGFRHAADTDEPRL